MKSQNAEEYLSKIVRDLYDFIIEESRQGPIQTVPPIYERVVRHDSYDALVESIAQDDSLKMFFPALRKLQVQNQGVGFLKTLQSIAVWSDGSAEGLTMLSLCCAIIRWLFELSWSWNEHPSLEDALSQLPKVIDSARTLARGRRVNVPAVVAIHNVGLTSDRDIPIGSAVLRRPTRFDRSHLLGVRLGPDMDATLRLNIGFKRIHIRSVDQTHDREIEQQKTLRLVESRGQQAAEQQARQVQDSTDVARLAIVLSSPRGKFFAPFQSWNSVLNPLADVPAGMMSNLQGLMAPYPKQDISVSVDQHIDSSARKLERYASALRTGGRRLLLAITERLYPEDGLVDAVICWESLFSGTPETTLRVCGSMAKLLGPADVAGRHELYIQLRDLYLERNKVVHGAERNPATVIAARNAAVQHALDAFQAILQRNDLLRARDSSERGLTTLLSP
jgi:hypothetical protein